MPSSREEARAALNEIVAAGHTKKLQERWVVLGGRLQQGERNLRMKKYENSPGAMPRTAAFHPGIQTHEHPTFQNRSANVGNLPDLPLRFAFVGTSGSGKGVAVLDLLLRHYRGAFDRIYLYSRSASLDRGWDPLRKYVEEVQHVNQDDEPSFFDEFDSKALQEQMDLQMRVAAYAKKAKHKEIPQVL